jgi:hypothetical protein
VQYPRAALPIDPYVLGLWLADGKHTSGEVSKPDDFVFDECVRRGYPVNMATGGNTGKCPMRTVQRLASALRALGLKGNKHVPAAYMTASVAQRLDLLRGLMDGDGYANPGRKCADFVNLDPRLVAAVKELVASLGMRPYNPTVTTTGFGKTFEHTPVRFTPRGLNPFLLPRKANVFKVAHQPGNWKSNSRRIVGIEKVKATPSQCIAVDSPDRTYLVTRDYLVTHNTGSSRYGTKGQEQRYAACLFMLHPWCDTVKLRWMYLKEGPSATVRHDFTRDQLDALIAHIHDPIQQIKHSYDVAHWPKKPSGLCNGWCGVKDCDFWKPKREKR